MNEDTTQWSVFSLLIVDYLDYVHIVIDPTLFTYSVVRFAHVQVTYTVGRDPLSVKNIVAESPPLFSAPVIVRTIFFVRIMGLFVCYNTQISRIMILYFLVKLHEIAGPFTWPH